MPRFACLAVVLIALTACTGTEGQSVAVPSPNGSPEPTVSIPYPIDDDDVSDWDPESGGFEYLADLSFVDGRRGFAMQEACGEADCSSAVYATVDAGKTWRMLTDYGPGHEMGGITFVNANVGWLYGWELLETRDAGKTWSGPSGGGDIELFGAQGHDALVASSGTVWTTQADNPCGIYDSPCRRFLYKSLDAGRRWTTVGLTPPIGGSSDLGVWGRTIWIGGRDVDAGRALVIVSEDGGKNWRVARLPCADAGFRNSFEVRPSSTRGAWLVCGGDGADKVLYRSFDAGRSWRLLSRIPLSKYGIDLEVVDDSVAWIMREHSGVAVTSNGGWSWRESLQEQPRERFEFVRAFGRTLAWVALNDAVYRTQDGGRHWKRMPFPGQQTSR